MYGVMEREVRYEVKCFGWFSVALEQGKGYTCTYIIHRGIFYTTAFRLLCPPTLNFVHPLPYSPPPHPLPPQPPYQAASISP